MDFNFSIIATVSPQKTDLFLIPTIRVESELEVTESCGVQFETNTTRISLILFVLQLQFEFISSGEIF
ncbi:MAG: hypothetical protein LCH54_15635 [Bacteroidetes bacterium]|nr:hypothetical protein [Bacteroidota bacterium]